MERKDDFTQGAILPALTRFALPVLLAAGWLAGSLSRGAGGLSQGLMDSFGPGAGRAVLTIYIIWMELLLALRLGIVKLEQVKEVGLFLTGIFPLLFVPAAAGVMELWAEMGNMLLPIIIAIVPVTVLVLASAGRTTQALTSRRKNKEAAHD